MTVWIVHAWMGDLEWIEGIYASGAGADAKAAELWSHRSSDRAPEWTHGFQKFAVEEHEVLP